MAGPLGGPDRRASKAAEVLQMHLDQGGHWPGFLPTQWLAGGLRQRLGWQTSTGRVVEYLDTRIGDLTANHFSWLITTLCAAELPAGHPLIVKAASLLEQSQSVDDYWESEMDLTKMCTRHWKPCEPCSFADALENNSRARLAKQDPGLLSLQPAF